MCCLSTPIPFTHLHPSNSMKPSNPSSEKVRVERKEGTTVIAQFMPLLTANQFKDFFEAFCSFKRRQALLRPDEVVDIYSKATKKLLTTWPNTDCWKGDQAEISRLVQTFRNKFQTQASTMGENKEMSEKFLVVMGNVALYYSPSHFFKAREEGFYSSFADILGEAMGKLHPGAKLSEEYKKQNPLRQDTSFLFKESTSDDIEGMEVRVGEEGTMVKAREEEVGEEEFGEGNDDYYEYEEEDTILQEGFIEDEGEGEKIQHSSLWGEKEGREYQFQEKSGKKTKLSREQKQKKQKAQAEREQRQKSYGDAHLSQIRVLTGYNEAIDEDEDKDEEVEEEEWKKFEKEEDRRKQVVSPIVKYAIDKVPPYLSYNKIIQCVANMLKSLGLDSSDLKLVPFSSGGIRSKPYKSYWVYMRHHPRLDMEGFVSMKGKSHKLVQNSAYDRLLLLPIKDSVTNSQKNVLSFLEKSAITGVKDITFPLVHGVSNGQIRLTFKNHASTEEAYTKLSQANYFWDYNIVYCLSPSSRPPPPIPEPQKYRVTIVPSSGNESRDEDDEHQIKRIVEGLSHKASHFKEKEEDHLNLFHSIRADYERKKKAEQNEKENKGEPEGVRGTGGEEDEGMKFNPFLPKSMTEGQGENAFISYDSTDPIPTAFFASTAKLFRKPNKQIEEGKDLLDQTTTTEVYERKYVQQFPDNEANKEGEKKTKVKMKKESADALRKREEGFQKILKDEYAAIIAALERFYYNRRSAAHFLSISPGALSRRVNFLMKKGFSFQLPKDFRVHTGIVHLSVTQAEIIGKEEKTRRLQEIYIDSFIPETRWDEIKAAKEKDKEEAQRKKEEESKENEGEETKGEGEPSPAEGGEWVAPSSKNTTTRPTKESTEWRLSE